MIINHIKSPFIQCFPNASTCHLPLSSPFSGPGSACVAWIPNGRIQISQRPPVMILGSFPKQWNYGKENDERSGLYEVIWDISGISGIFVDFCGILKGYKKSVMSSLPPGASLGDRKHHNSGRICLADVAKRPFKDCTLLCLTCGSSSSPPDRQ